MIKGLELAGKNPRRANVIKDLRGLKSYTANGLLPNPINYSTIFGHDLPTSRVGRRSREERIRIRVVAADVWYGHPRHLDSEFFLMSSKWDL